MSARRVHLGYELSHFLNFSEQLAARSEDHATVGNLVCHLIAAPLLGVASLSLVHFLCGYSIAFACVLVLATWSLINDVTYGIVYSIFVVTTSIYQLSADSWLLLDIYFILGLFTVAVVIQLGIGHAYFERRPPNELEGIMKGDGRLFAVLDFTCELVPATFHFYTILLMKLGFRPELNSQVQTELKRINVLIQGH